MAHYNLIALLDLARFQGPGTRVSPVEVLTKGSLQRSIIMKDKWKELKYRTNLNSGPILEVVVLRLPDPHLCMGAR